jgi:hypothetical protein
MSKVRYSPPSAVGWLLCLASRRHLPLTLVAFIALSGIAPGASGRRNGETGKRMVFPADAGYLDVKRDLGAKGDGITDDTAALKRIFEENNGFIYFPNGIYLIRDTLTGTKFKRRILQGESEEGVILRLADNAPGFDNSANPRPVLSFYDNFMNPKSANGQAFRNALFHMTIEVGKGNPGAVGVHYFNNNQGAVENVTIRSRDPERRGHAGFALVTNWPGPALFRNLTIEGFDYGVWSTIGQYSNAFESLNLSGQRVAGLYNRRQMLTIRGLRSVNTVPAIQAEQGLLVLTDAVLSGGTPRTGAAISQREGRLFARNVAVKGYNTAIRYSPKADTAREAAGPKVAEFLSEKPVALFGDGAATGNLPIRDTPNVPWDDPKNWANVRAFGAVPAVGDNRPDSTAAVQKALDSGKTTVYFPKGVYVINDTLTIRGNVRRIIGCESTIQSGDGFKGTEKPLWRLADGAAPVVVLERFESGYGNQAAQFIDHASRRTLVIRNAICHGGYRNTVPGGTVFLDDYCGGDLVFDRQTVYARQLNPENAGTKVTNRGGTLWCLNLKTEKAGTCLLTTDGGRSEVLGGYLYYNRGNEGSIAVVTDNASVSIVAWLTGARGGDLRNPQRRHPNLGTLAAPVRIRFTLNAPPVSAVRRVRASGRERAAARRGRGGSPCLSRRFRGRAAIPPESRPRHDTPRPVRRSSRRWCRCLRPAGSRTARHRGRTLRWRGTRTERSERCAALRCDCPGGRLPPGASAVGSAVRR